MTKLLLLSLAAAIAPAQTAPTFEVASIKPNRSLSGMSSMRPSNGRVSMENVSLKKLMLNAYGIPDGRDYRIAGPDWLTTERFDIEATFPPGTAVPQLRMMLQALLAERFQLKLHTETRQLPVYNLEIAKGGPKLHKVEDVQSHTSSGPGRLEATGITMPNLADLLARQLGAPITDSTGISGAFNFTLEWSPGDGPDPSPGPSIFSALQEQLGLKLPGAKGPVEVLVVDHIEKSPTEN